MIRAASLLALLLAASSATAADAPAPPAAPAAESAATAPASAAPAAKKTCRLEKSLGSNMPKRVCTTAAEREAARDKAQQLMQQGNRCSGSDMGSCNVGS